MLSEVYCKVKSFSFLKASNIPSTSFIRLMSTPCTYRFIYLKIRFSCAVKSLLSALPFSALV